MYIPLPRILIFLLLFSSVCFTACAVQPSAPATSTGKNPITEKQRVRTEKKKSKVPVVSNSVSVGMSTPATAGQKLYAVHCEDCHGKLNKTKLQNFRASRIRSSFTQFPIMNQLKEISDAELQEISTALNQRQTAGR